MPNLAAHELTPEECRLLLAAGGLGRVAVSVAALPAIYPVHFALVADDVVIRAPTEGTLARALLGSVVAFEADGGKQASRCSWSVHVIGLAVAIEDERIAREAGARGLDAWPLEDPFLHVGIPTKNISGRLVDPSVGFRS